MDDGAAALDQWFRAETAATTPGPARAPQDTIDTASGLTGERCLELFDSQATSRHLDLAARRLGREGRGYYSIGSSGHEGNAAVAAALRVTDPALLHYRSGAFFVERARRVPGLDPIRDVLLGVTAAAADPISGGRHKVFGSKPAHIIPQTSTIASHLPRAVGLAFALDRAAQLHLRTEWPADAVVVCSFGDASANHSTAAGAINTAIHTAHQRVPMPILFVCEDNGLGISVPTPRTWIEQAYGTRPGLKYFDADGTDLPAALAAATAAADHVRAHRTPAFLRLRTVRLLGHAGSDVESAYRRATDIAADLHHDPVTATARLLVTAGVATADEVIRRYDEIGARVAEAAEKVGLEPKLSTAAEVTAPLASARPALVRADALRTAPLALSRADSPTAQPNPAAAPASPTVTPASPAAAPASPTAAPVSPTAAPVSPTAAPASPTAAPAGPSAARTGPPAASTGPAALSAGRDAESAAAQANSPVAETSPTSGAALTLAQAINQTLAQLLARDPDVLVFGEDVGRKGGVYGVTKGLQQSFGGRRVFDTLLDEQSVLGTALGAGLAGFVPIPEIQYLAYVHNAEDQLRGEAATLSFFSGGRYRNPVVVRIAGLAYQKGFGGHFHNENSLAALRDIPGLVLAVPSRADDAAAMLRTCVAAARVDGRVCVFVEPIALYHTRDLYRGGDGGWLAPISGVRHAEIGRARVYGGGADLTIVTFGNGVPMSLRVARRLAERGMHARVLDLRWLAPLPVADLLDHARATGRVLIADETRRSGGVSEAVCTALLDAGFEGRMARVTSANSFVPLGPAASTVLLDEAAIEAAALALSRDR
ncbi:thiamine pyrophosphate-dependent enzyme [Nocardia tengchongensis]|uniref:thiamine pyrophosphate-dependent enzyme n=1 Tax=Nocardia tengchongensis TaxID=2055889 RepID=UPI0036800E7B